MKKNLFAFGLCLLTAWTIMGGCTDSFLDKSDRTSINSTSFYNNEADALASVNAVYALTQSLDMWARRWHFMQDFSSDEVATTPNTQGPPLELLLHTFGPQGNEHINGPWLALYRTIAKANITLAEVPAIDMDADLKARILGEARFLRALSYFYVVSQWNGGPLRTDENQEQLHVPRASAQEIWAFIEADLNAAQAALPWVYDAAEAGRATKGAALSLLGKAYLYQEKWSDAETTFENVINNGPYELVGEGAATVEEAIAAMRSNHDFGVKNNAESVFEIQFKSGEGGLFWGTDGTTRRESTIRPHEYGANGKSFFNARPSQALLSAFAGYDPNGGNTGIGERDPRFEAFFFTENDTLNTGPYSDILAVAGYAFKKYQHSTEVSFGNGDHDVNHDVIRFADVILMNAEAKIRQSKVADGVALINRIRRRADPTGNILPNIESGVSQEAAIQALIRERQVELCVEQVRRADLVRWGIAAQHLQGFQSGKHEYFPIPQDEIDNNLEMSQADQNPGY